jgi:hypothetical protein
MKPEIIEVDRLIENTGTWGELSYRDARFATMELPWKNNAPYHSCIPAGLYRVRLGVFSRGDGGNGYPDLEFVDVPGRSLIEMHAAEKPSDLWGCIAIGRFIQFESDTWRIAESRRALEKLLRLLGENLKSGGEILFSIK